MELEYGALTFLNDPQKVVASYRLATELDPGNAADWNSLGGLYQHIGELAKAEAAFIEALELGEKQGDKSVFAVTLRGLGGVYHAQGDLDKAEEFYRKALEIEEQLGNKGDYNGI
jgi:tetratricopeptide (TPR) repeat protein